MSQTSEATKDFAALAHEGQMYGDKPYLYHLEQVVDVLIRFGFTDAELRDAGWLHDTVEDTYVTLAEIEENFGTRVAYLVEGVTNEEGQTRKERMSKTYPKIKEDPDRITLKLADRIANVEHCIETNSDLFDMYKSEYPQFRAELYMDGPHQAMWRHLDFLLDFETGVQEDGQSQEENC